MKEKLWRGVRSLYLSHILATVLSIFLFATLWSLASRSGTAYSALTTLLYAVMLYSVGWNCGDRDGRKIPGFYPNPKLPFLIAAFGAVLPLLLYILRFACPDLWHVNVGFINGEFEFLLTGNRLQGTMDLIYKLWYFPFEAFLGNGNPLLYLLPIVLQSVLVIVGYFVGTTRFRLMDTILHKLVFYKKKKKK